MNLSGNFFDLFKWAKPKPKNNSKANNLKVIETKKVIQVPENAQKLGETLPDSPMGEEKDSIQSSIAQVYGEQNPFIKAEESEEYKRLEKEYKDFRKRKVLSRIDPIIMGINSSKDGAVIAELKDKGRAKATVLPCSLKQAKKAFDVQTRLEVLVNYPLAVGTKKAVLYEIKAAFRQNATVSVGVNCTQTTSGNFRQIEKTLASLARKNKRHRRVFPMFYADELSVEAKKRIARLCNKYKFTGVRIQVGLFVGDVSPTADTVKTFCDVLGERCPVIAVGNIGNAGDADQLFLAGAERIITTDFFTLSRQRLDDVGI